MSGDPILVVDVGNTSTTVALFRDGRVEPLRRYHSGVEPVILLEEAREKEGIAGLALCSVVPRETRNWQEAARELPVVSVNHRVALGIPISYPQPETVGADRFANAVAAVERYGAPAIVADFGTALTFDVVVPERGYIGGVIAPGLPLMFQYLHEKTALLPAIGPEETDVPVGKSTEQAMRIGAQVGYRGMVREILNEIREELALPEVSICGTGGDAEWVLGALGERIHIDPDLTLFGTVRIFEKNR